MKGKRVIYLIIIYFLYGCGSNKEIVTYCNQKLIAKQVKVYLVDEDIETTMIQLSDRKSRSFVFGYFKSGITNDTNFIHSKFLNSGDTLVRTTYREFKITHGCDSVISKYICVDNQLKAYSHTTYWNGQIFSEIKE